MCIKKSNCKAVYVRSKLLLLLGLKKNMMVAIGQCFFFRVSVILGVSVHGSVGREMAGIVVVAACGIHILCSYVVHAEHCSDYYSKSRGDE